MQIWCDLKYAKELFLWGVEQESYFFWRNVSDNYKNWRWTINPLYDGYVRGETISAWTAEELLIKLPNIVKVDSNKRDIHGKEYTHIAERSGPTRPTWLHIWIEKNGDYTVSYKGYNGYTMWKETDKSLANACAKMFLYLIKNNLTSKIYRKKEN